VPQRRRKADAGDLRIFEAVARLGGISRAAGELHRVQSNVTARIRLLEDELGAALFLRNSRGVVLTPAASSARAVCSSRLRRALSAVLAQIWV
jgi:DNA-binding transcriptional LysR family regulator